MWFRHILLCCCSNACDYTWCVCESNDECTIMRHLSHKSIPVAKKSVPIHMQKVVLAQLHRGYTAIYQGVVEMHYIWCVIRRPHEWMHGKVRTSAVSKLLHGKWTCGLRHAEWWFQEPRMWSNLSMWVLLLSVIRCTTCTNWMRINLSWCNFTAVWLPNNVHKESYHVRLCSGPCSQFLIQPLPHLTHWQNVLFH